MRVAEKKFYTALSASAALIHAIPFLGRQATTHDYEDALVLVEYLIDHDDENPLIDILAKKISAWENVAPAFADFNARIDATPRELAVLRVLMDQHGLNQSSFQQEIGSRSLVSMIMSGQRALTLEHMRALAKRFSIPLATFIE